MRIRKQFQVGLFVLIQTVCLTAVAGIPVQVSQAPSCDYELTTHAISKAKETLLINAYELTSNDIADAIIETIKRGVQVTVLMEGQPVGGIQDFARNLHASIVDAMNDSKSNCHFYEMTGKASQSEMGKNRGNKRRFKFDHAKYMVVDGRELLIGSENYSPSGHPKNGAKGNRGWEVLVDDQDLAGRFSAMFASDSSLDHGDIVDRTQESLQEKAKGTKNHFYFSNVDAAGSRPRSGKKVAVQNLNATDVREITVPDNGLEGLIELIQNSKNEMDLELMSFDLNWGGDRSIHSPLIEAVMEAAKRGVKIRVLLNDDRVFNPHGKPEKFKNPRTVKYLNEESSRGNLPIEARIANVKGMNVTYIHNKGMLIKNSNQENGFETVVSSINWGQNATTNNREAAVILGGKDVYSYYHSTFDTDWEVSDPSTFTLESFASSFDPGSLVESGSWLFQ